MRDGKELRRIIHLHQMVDTELACRTERQIAEVADCSYLVRVGRMHEICPQKFACLFCLCCDFCTDVSFMAISFDTDRGTDSRDSITPLLP